MPRLIAARIASPSHLRLTKLGYLTHHVDGQIDYMEFAGKCPTCEEITINRPVRRRRASA